MFEKIVIRRHTDGENPIDAGLLAETLLFYNHVHLLFDQGNLNSLLSTIGPDNLLLLLEQKRISGTFLTDNLGTYGETRNGIQFNKYIAFKIAANKDGKRVSQKDWATRGFINTLGDSWATKKKAQKFLDYVPFRTHGNVAESSSADLVRIADKDLDDRAYVKTAVETILRNAVPNFELPRNWFFYIVRSNSEFTCCSDLDFGAINREYHKLVSPMQNSITPAWLLSTMLVARSDAFFAADYMSEFATDRVRSGLIQLRFNELLKRRFSSEAELSAFQNLNFGNSRTIREAINSGEKSFDDFLSVLDRASRFKDWLSEQNPDVGLISAYYKAATSETWVDKLPTKLVRFVVCALASLVPIAGPVVGFGDAVFFDRLVKGWKPNQFVEGPLRRFIDD